MTIQTDKLEWRTGLPDSPGIYLLVNKDRDIDFVCWVSRAKVKWTQGFTWNSNKSNVQEFVDSVHKNVTANNTVEFHIIPWTGSGNALDYSGQDLQKLSSSDSDWVHAEITFSGFECERLRFHKDLKNKEIR